MGTELCRYVLQLTHSASSDELFVCISFHHLIGRLMGEQKQCLVLEANEQSQLIKNKSLKLKMQ